VHVVEGEGMPIPISSEDNLVRHLETFNQIPRGNLYVKFNILFPSDLTAEKKQKILDILGANRQELERENEDD
jgi:DnaJ-class molecular chaperone